MTLRRRLCILLTIPLFLSGCQQRSEPSDSVGPGLPPLHVEWSLVNPGDRAILLDLVFTQAANCTVDLALTGELAGNPVNYLSGSWLGRMGEALPGLTGNWSFSVIASSHAAGVGGFAAGPLTVSSDAFGWLAESRAARQFTPGERLVIALTAFGLKPMNGVEPHLDLQCDAPVEARLHGGSGTVRGLTPGSFGEGAGVRAPPVMACDETAEVAISEPIGFVQVYHEPYLQRETPVQLLVETPSSSSVLELESNRSVQGVALDGPGPYRLECDYAGPSPVLVLAVAGVSPLDSLAALG